MTDGDVYRDVTTILRPKSIAVVGASPGGSATRRRRNLRDFGFTGPVYLINPKYDAIEGERCYRALSAVDAPIDHVVVLVPAHVTPSVLEEAGQLGIRSATIFAAGFAEEGSQRGHELNRSVASLLDRHGIRACGPNVMGNVSVEEGVVTFSEYDPEVCRLGPFSVVAQSGGLMGAVLRYGSYRGVGFRYAVDSGNEINTDLADYVHFMVQDPKTKAIGLCLESVRRPDAFRHACAAARDAGKPIVALRIGKSPAGRQFALSHTAALAGAPEVFLALCRAEAIIPVDSVDELVEFAVLFSHIDRLPPGGPAVLTLSGGLRGLMADALTEYGVAVAQFRDDTLATLRELLVVGSALGNPLDIGWTGISAPDRYVRAIETIAKDPSVDMVLLQEMLPASEDRAARSTIYADLRDAAVRQGKPVAFFSTSSYEVTRFGREFQAALGAPFLQDGQRTAKLAGCLQSWRQHLRQANERTADETLPHLDLADLSLSVSPEELRSRGFPFVETMTGVDEQLWRNAFRRFGAPAVAKVGIPALLHKTERSGVSLDLRSEDEVVAAARAIQTRFASTLAGDEPVPVMVQPQHSGVEVLVSVGRDPELGPFALVGWGGIWTELMHDVVAFVPPITAGEVQSALIRLRIGRLLVGFRREPSDVEALARFVAALANVAGYLPDAIRSLEFNPVLVGPPGQGLTIVDVAVESSTPPT